MFHHLSPGKISSAFFRRLLCMFVFCSLAGIARAHTIELRALLNGDGSATFYARTYHGTSELPSGGFIVDGVTYPFVGSIPAPSLPSGTLLISACTFTFSSSDNYQYVTVPGFNACISHAFNCTSNAPETPLCTLASTVNLGGPQVTQQPAYADGHGCLGGVATITVAVSGSNISYQWQVNMGGGFNAVLDDAVYDGSTTSTLTINPVTAAMANYVFRCVVSGSGFCGGTSSATTNEFPLTISNPPAITTQPISATLCKNTNSAGFLVAATGAGLTYQWQSSTDNGSNWSDIAGKTASSLNLAGITTASDNYQYHVVIAGTCPAPVTSNPAILNVIIPITGFSVNKTDQCTLGNNFLFTNTSTVNHGSLSFLWNFADGKTSTEVHPSHIYPTAGNYNVKLLVTGSSGCKDSLSAYAVVHAMPDAALTLNKAAQCLKSNLFVFTDGSTTSDEGSQLRSAWDFGDGSIATTAIASKTYQQAGYYKVVLTSSSNFGCTDTAITNIRVAPDPIGFILPPLSTTICQGSNVALQASGGLVYQWFKNGDTIRTAINATYLATVAGTYTAMIQGDAGCTSMSSNSISLSLISKPAAAFSYSAGCAGKPVQFSNNTVTGGTTMQYTWFYGDSAIANVTQSAHTYVQAGTYKVQLVASPSACSLLTDTASQSIIIQSAAVGVRLPSLNATVNTPLQLQARDMNVTYQWRPPGVLNNATIRTPVATLQNETTFFIDMQSPVTCVTTDTLLVRIFKNDDIFIPTGFTPDGDGRNDVFRAIMVQAREFHYLRVFNRSGKMIFESTDVTRGWDGTWNGRKEPTDTYMWSCEAVGTDGRIIRKYGSITLIR